jgi:hypothetical protein
MNTLLSMELEVLEEGREWTRQRLEARAQKQVNDWGSFCPQNGELLQRRKRQRMKLLIVSGVIKLKTWRGYSRALRRWVNPAREHWGLKPRQPASPELQSRLSYNATVAGSYEKAARLAQRWGSPVSDDLVHATIQRLGARAGELKWPEPPRPSQEPEFSMVLSMDGWLARERGADWGADPRRKNVVRVCWKEIKSAVIYRLEQRVEKDSGRGLLLHKYVVACESDTEPVDFGAKVQAEALRRGLARAKKVYVVMDGAVWLWNLAQDRFREAILVLDFQHASQHLWAVGHALHGEGTDGARAWTEPLLHQLRHGQEEKVIHTLEALLKPTPGRTRQSRKTLQTEVQYFQTHRDHIHYHQVDRQGGPIGSGSVESLCSQFQDRFKRTGQFWSKPGFRHLMAIDVLLRNEDYDTLWN